MSDARWQELVTLVEQEFWAHNQHPGGGVFQHDHKGLKLSGILKNGAYYSEVLTDDQLLQGDLPRIAKEFYKGYRTETEEP